MRLGATLIIITHNAAIGGMGDRVIRMSDGHVRDILVNARRRSPEELEW